MGLHKGLFGVPLFSQPYAGFPELFMKVMPSAYLTSASDAPVYRYYGTNSWSWAFREESNHPKVPKHDTNEIHVNNCTLKSSFTSYFSLIFKRWLLNCKDVFKHDFFLSFCCFIINEDILTSLVYLRHLKYLHLFLLNMRISTIHRNCTNIDELSCHFF